MKTLIVAGNPHHADYIRRQHPDTKTVKVITPGEHIGNRFDLILVTDQYRRERHYSNDQTGLDRWFEESVRTRLGSPEARLIML